MTHHFVQRARERGPEGIDAKQLRDAVAQAVRENRDDLVERVKRIDEGQAFYRFRIGEENFYAVVNEATGAPITFYTQAQYRGKRFALKCKRRHLPPPGFRSVRSA